MKHLIFAALSIAILFGCSPKEAPSTIPQQKMDANHTYLDATITDFKVEDGKYTIYFEGWNRGDIKGKATTTESLYKGLEAFPNKGTKFDIIVDGDDSFILGIAPAENRKERP